MKKAFTFLSALLIAGSVFASDREGSFAIGYQGSFDSFNNSTPGTNTTLGDWSVKYGVASNITLQGVVGFDLGDIDKNINLGARVLYDVVENENSDFYTGLGFGYGINENINPDGFLIINVPLGFAWSFAGLPEIEFSAEAGVNVSFDLAAETTSFSSVGGQMMWGAHYYF